MGIIKEWTLTVCTVMIICAFLSVFIPRGSYDSLIKIVLSAFIIYSILMPVSKGIDIKSFNLPDNLQMSYDISETDKKLIEANIKSYLVKNGIIGAKIECDIDNSQEISEIEYIRIYIPDEYEKEQVKEQIYNDLGFVTEVNYIGD